MSKHSPAPWKVEDSFVFSENGLRVAGCYCEGQENEMSLEEQEANAALIAAAPAMYSALEIALDHIECNCGGKCFGTCDRALVNAALQKARGAQ